MLCQVFRCGKRHRYEQADIGKRRICPFRIGNNKRNETGRDRRSFLFFKTREEFENMIKEDAFVEYACYVGNYYGTPKAFVEEKISEGKDVLLEIEIQGALKIKEKFPSAVLIFITTKDAKTLKDRLTGRGTETEDVIEKRLNRAAEEAKGVEAYDYIVVNDILEDCVETVDRIIKSEHNRTSEKISVIEDIRKELSKHTV